MDQATTRDPVLLLRGSDGDRENANSVAVLRGHAGAQRLDQTLNGDRFARGKVAEEDPVAQRAIDDLVRGQFHRRLAAFDCLFVDHVHAAILLSADTLLHRSDVRETISDIAVCGKT